VFLIRRIFRIVPAMWVSAAAAIFLAVLQHNSALADHHVLFNTFIFRDISLNPPLWSTVAEFWCSKRSGRPV
jgi:peptidoglycan/LPS O-acetylase OafA/YrhL